MKEWQDPFNSFNSWKGLLYSDWYESIRDWKNKEIFHPMPPIELSLDPIHQCNLNCKHCNAHRYLNTQYRMTNDHLIKLVCFLSSWGVKSVCFGGGGEPTLHPNLTDAIWKSRINHLESSVASNGTLFTEELIQAMAECCRWVGVSVDAATPKTYALGRNKDLFKTVIKNIDKLQKKVAECNSFHTFCDVAFKFLIFDYNQHEIFDACKIAKDLGVKDFHARPADFRHQGLGEWKKKNSGYNIELINEQFEKCHSIEDSGFRVFTVTHKFDKDFIPKKNFSQCYASPIGIQLCADGKIYLCPDTRHCKDFVIGTHYPDVNGILKVWGSKKHYDLVFNTGKKLCTSRCTFSPYNEMCERLFINSYDPMCRNFV